MNEFTNITPHTDKLSHAIIQIVQGQPGTNMLSETQKDLHQRTRGKCDTNSLKLVAGIMAGNKREPMWEKGLVLIGSDDVDKPFTGPFGGGIHAYAVFETVDGKWLATSPANFNKPEDVSESIIEKSTAAKIVSSIIEKDGGKWPDPSEIDQILEKYQKPQKTFLRKRIKIWTITQTPRNIETGYLEI